MKLIVVITGGLLIYSTGILHGLYLSLDVPENVDLSVLSGSWTLVVIWVMTAIGGLITGYGAFSDVR